MSIKALYDQKFGVKTAAPKAAAQLPEELKRDFVLGKVASAAFHDELGKLNEHDAAELRKLQAGK